MNLVDLTTGPALSSNNIDVNAMTVFLDEITDEDQLFESHPTSLFLDDSVDEDQSPESDLTSSVLDDATNWDLVTRSDVASFVSDGHGLRFNN